MENINVGDKIYHKSNYSVIWVVEKITEEGVHCSTVIKETFEQKKETFAITSIEKYSSSPIYISKPKRNNFW